MRKTFDQQKPEKGQIIIFKSKGTVIPEIGIFESFDNGIQEVYIPANDDVEQLDNIEWWVEIPE